jgi:hypothetical protein
MLLQCAAIIDFTVKVQSSVIEAGDHVSSHCISEVIKNGVWQNHNFYYWLGPDDVPQGPLDFGMPLKADRKITTERPPHHCQSLP